jgi:hypothetical protein
MRVLFLFVASLLCASPRVAFGQATLTQNTDAKGEARRYFQAGVSLQKTDDFEAAIGAYTTSLQLYPTKSAWFNLANCQRAMHRYAEAWDSLNRLHEQFGSQLEEPMLSTSKAQLEELENLTGLLTIDAQPQGATIFVDGKTMGTAPSTEPLRVAIGQHDVTVSLEGYATQSSVVKLSPKQTLTLSLKLVEARPEPPPQHVDPAPKPTASMTERAHAPSSPATPALTPPRDTQAPPNAGHIERSTAWQTAGWVGMALGGLAVAAGARTGILALEVDRDLAAACDEGRCSQRNANMVERLDRLALSSNLFIGVGAAFLVTGATLVLWPSASESNAASNTAESVTLSFGPQAVRLGGHF